MAEQPDWRRIADMRLSEWTPMSQLRAPETSVERSAVPCIDVHNHLGRWLSGGDWQAGTAPWIIDDAGALVDLMDERNVETVVNLDGMWGEEVTANVRRYDESHPGRFLTFCQLDWSVLAQPNGVAQLIASLEDSVARGARGVKVWKTLGLHVRDADGTLIRPDDPRVIEVLSAAGDHGLPVLIHTADPVAFFQPVDAFNERVDELSRIPEWWFGDSSRFPDFDTLLDCHARLVLSCPGTRFIGAHVGCAAEDLDRVELLLAAASNYAVDIAGRMAEIGRQPRRFTALLERFGDRVLFGTDIYPATDEQFRLHFRFLETGDESFDYDPGSLIPGQGRWKVSALALEGDQLRHVYRENALAVLGLNG
ncbi:amidohydrolase family protein [Glaciibacter flavus]|uniref:amidohydrolase family protein n=1 Tax=Orlajensenia flava TaxID=2565934 RepID=UPI003B007EDA